MGDQENTRAWFSASVQQNMDALFGVALRLTRSRPAAEDLGADSVVKAWSAIDSLEDRGRFRPWLFRIMRNLHISDCRKQSVRPVESCWSELSDETDGEEVTSLLLEQPDSFLAWWATPERELVNRMLGEQIRCAIAALPEAFRVVVLLVNVEGLAYDEAAEVLGVPTGTIRSRMKRGRTLLQKALWEQAQEAGLAGGKSKP
jgi:RNA polymerase sigma-70 factor (ECF subfamily)